MNEVNILASKFKIVDGVKQYINVCKICGDEFLALTPRAKYCSKQHYKKCANCGKEFEYNAPFKTIYCSTACSSAARAYRFDCTCRICGKKFKGRNKNDNVCQRPHPWHCCICGKDIIIKQVKTGRNEYTCGSKECQLAFRKKNAMAKYGVDDVKKTPEQRKIASVNRKKAIKREGTLINEKRLKTLAGKKQEIIKQIDNSSIKHVDKTAPKPNKWNKDVINFNDFYYLTDFLKINDPFTANQLAEYFNVARKRIIDVTRGTDMRAMLLQDEVNSKYEQRLIKYLRDNCPNVKYIHNNRTILGGRELDFYFPEQKLAIELSPTRTHNSTRGYDGEKPKSKNYHKQKFLDCDKLGIELITFFEWMPWNKITELITTKLSISNARVYARKTVFHNYDYIDKDLFDKLSNWHILSLPSNYKRKAEVSTLEYNNDVIGIALWKSTNDDKVIELKRMVFKPGISVVGGASKLLKNYVGIHNYKKVITFSDCDLGRGAVYSKIGFNLIEEHKPTLVWNNPQQNWTIKNTSLYMQGADRLLANFPGYVPVGMGDNLPSNKEIVESYGFLPVYDCGYRKWELNVK
jgi:hypothetical protein